MGLNQRYRGDIVAEILTATKILPPGVDGQLYFLDLATGFTVRLPRVAKAGIGHTIKFIVKTAPASGIYVITEDVEYDTNVIVTNGINELDVDTGNNGPYNAGHTTLTFADGVSVAGDWVEFECDGDVWYCTGQTNADGGVTLA